MTTPTKNKTTTERKIKTGICYRAAQLDTRSVDVEARTVALAFSSETDQVVRWGGVEILDHSPGSVRLGRLNDSGPFLADHDARDHIGVIVSAEIDSKDKVGRAVVRLGNSERAGQILQDIADGIRVHVSVGYRIHTEVLEKQTDEGPDTYRVTDWEPYEISSVAIPADHSVGVGRSADQEFETVIIEPTPTQTRRGDEMPKELTAEEERAAKEREEARRAEVATTARNEELARIRDINAMADQAGHMDSEIETAARTFINEGKSAEEFRQLVLTRVLKAKPLNTDQPPALLGLDGRQLASYSIMNVIRALQSGDMSKVGFERELSAEIASRTGQESRGIIVPLDVMAMGVRDLNVGVGSAGGNLVGTDHRPDMFVDLLRNRSMLVRLGALVLPGLVGNVDIPTQAGGTAFYWVDEAGNTTESAPTFGQVALTPKTISGRVDVTRRLMMQSAPGIEALLRMDMISGIGVGIDAAGIAGTGANGQPLGILNATGIGDVPGGANGLAPTWANMVALETEVAVDNADIGNLAYLTTAQARGKMKTTEKASNTAKFIWDGGEINGYQAHASQNVPSNLVKGASGAICSASIFGNFADLIIGMWGGVDIKLDESTNGDAGGTVIRVFQDVDVGLRHVESFAATQDLLTQ